MTNAPSADKTDMSRLRRPGDAHVVLVAALAVLVPAYLVTDGLWRDLVSAVAAATPLLVLGILLAGRQLARPRPWWLLFAGLLVLGAYTVVWMVDVHLLDVVPTGPVIALAQPISYLFFLAAAVEVTSRPTASRGGVVDGAIFAVSAALLFWALLLGPYVDALALPTENRMRAVAAVVVLGATAGALVGIARGLEAGRLPLIYLLVAVASAAAGTIARALTTSAEAVSGAWWLGLVWIVAFSALVAAVLDPATRTLAPAAPPRADRITPGTLVALGAALCVVPVISLAQAAAGGPVDGLAIGAGGLTLVPLVLVRIAQLARLHVVAEGRLAHLADHDELTGLANRRRLHAHVSAALARLERGETPGVVVFFCDLDDFKGVNDDHGHHVGDEVLLLITRRLRAAVREADLVARFGGDEFVVVVEGDPAVIEAETLARIEDALAEPVRIGPILAPTAVSVGSASAGRGSSTTPDGLLAAADASMYARKRARRMTRLDHVDPPRVTTRAEDVIPRQSLRR